MIWASPPEDRPYSDPLYDPFWAEAQELGMPLSLHSNTGMGPESQAMRAMGRELKSLRAAVLQHVRRDRPPVPRGPRRDGAGLQRPTRGEDLRGRPGRLDLRQRRGAGHPDAAHR